MTRILLKVLIAIQNEQSRCQWNAEDSGTMLERDPKTKRDPTIVEPVLPALSRLGQKGFCVLLRLGLSFNPTPFSARSARPFRTVPIRLIFNEFYAIRFSR